MRKWNYFLKTSLVMALVLFATTSFAQSSVQTKQVAPNAKGKVQPQQMVLPTVQEVQVEKRKIIVKPAHTPEEAKALREAEVVAVAAKKAQKRGDGISDEAMAYLRSSGHPEFTGLQYDNRKAAIAQWELDNADKLEAIKTKLEQLNK